MADEVLGSAYVVIRAITSRIKDDIREGVKKGANSSKRDLEEAGTTIGETVGEAAGEAAGAGITDGIERSTRRGRGRHRAIGTGVGRSITAGLGRGMRFASRTVRTAITQGGKLLDSARDIGSNIGKNISAGLKGAMPSLGALGLAAIIGIIPLITSGLSALTGSITAFIGAAAQASYVSFGLVGIFGALKQATVVLKLATGGLTEAIAGEEGAMAKLAPSAQGVVRAIQALKPEWTSLKRTIQDKVFEGIGPILEKIGEKILPVLQTQLGRTAELMNNLFTSLGNWVTSAGFVEKFGKALDGNNRIFQQMKRTVTPLLRGILNLYIALQPAAEKLATRIKEGAGAFRRWSTAPDLAERITKAFNRGWIAAGRLWRIVRNLGGVLKNVFGAAVGPGNGLLKTFVQLTGRLKRFTDLASTRNAIAEWAQKGIEVSGQLFGALGRGFNAIKGLFDPAILGGFLTVLEKVMPVITTIVGVFQDALAPILTKIGEAFEENGPKIAALFEAIAPLLKGVGSVIGEVISQALDMIGIIAQVITPVVAAISNFIGPILTKFAPIIAAIILSFTTWGAKLVSLIPIIGKFLAPIIKLVQYLLKQVAPVFGFLSKIVIGSFKLMWRIISSTLGFIFKIIGKVFGFIGKYVPNVVKTVFGFVSRGFGAIRRVIGGVVNDVWGTISRGFGRIVDFLGGLPGKLLRLAVAFLNAGTDLGKKIIEGLKEGVLGAAQLVTDIAGNVWDAVKNFLNGAIEKINAALEFTIKIPGPDININPPNIPQLATGGRATRGTLAVIGEGKEAETVLPDSLLGDLLEKANEAGQSRGGRGGTTVINNINNPAPERATKSVNRALTDASTSEGWAP